ncbi:MAG: efflux RND transporter periplasmic adaptor subunit [Alphaproteobacteria bacterium]|nr:efflux RND transporter periplasmic adaptor subunit [Alphaproteobacteria bacterium]
MLKRIPAWGWAALVVILVAGWWFTRDRAPKVEYQTAAIERGDIVTSISASGKIQALNTVEVGSQLSGQLVALYADFNTPVKRGQVLARIDPSTFTARVEQSTAQARAAAADVARAEAALKEAQRDFQTKSSLTGQGFVTKRSLETSEAAVAQAKAALAAAQAQSAQSRAVLDQQRIDVTRTYIRAPVDGVVIDRSINLGQTVAASFQAPKLFVIAEDLSRMQVEAAVDEADIGRVKKGQAVEFTVDAYPDDTFKGVVSEVRIAGVENQNVVTYTVVIEAPNPDRKLLPGMTANASIVVGEVRNVLKVPTTALRFQPSSVGAERQAQQRAEAGNPLGGGGNFMRSFGRQDAVAMTERMTAGLGISAEQRTKIEDIVDQSMRQMRGPNVDRAARQKAREDMRKKIAAVLTPAQREKFAAMAPQGGRGGGNAQSGGVWVLNAKGEPERRFVRFRTGDEQYAAVVGGQLKAGDAVVTGETLPAEDKK